MDLRDVVSDAVKSLQVKTNKSSMWTKWIWWILGGALGLALIAFLVLESLSKSQKAAKALHERDVLLEKQVQANTDAMIATSDKKKQVLIAKADKHLAKADQQIEKNEVLIKRAKKNQEIINDLKGWDDATRNIKF